MHSLVLCPCLIRPDTWKWSIESRIGIPDFRDGLQHADVAYSLVGAIMNHLHVISALCVSSAITVSSLATDRYYRDSFAISTNKRYRIDAKSPDNAGERARAFASNFTYTLIDLSINKVLWERKQPMTRQKGDDYAYSDEPSPIQVYVNDDGLVAARTSRESILVLAAVGGNKLSETNILEAFPKKQQDDYVHHTTGGPRWSQDSELYFLSVPSGPDPSVYFVIHPFWHHRLVIDVKTGKCVDLGVHHNAKAVEDIRNIDAPSKAILTAAIEYETRHAMDVLAAAPGSIKDDKVYHEYRRLGAALHIIGFLGLTQATPQLQELQMSIDGTIDQYGGIRAGIRQALRSLGKVPILSAGPCGPTYIKAVTSSPPNLTAEIRAANVAKIVTGMAASQVAELLGCPDASPYDQGHCQDYDIDATEPYTLRIYDNGGKITQVKKIVPFAFLHDIPRMTE